MDRGDKPAFLRLLETKGVYARGYFSVDGEDGGSPRRFAVTRSGKILGSDGAEAFFTENDIWERYERIHKVSRAAFLEERASRRDAVWKSRGQPTREELSVLAEQFAREYGSAGEWRAYSRYEEETLRRLAAAAAGRLPACAGRNPRKEAKRIYRDLILAKTTGRGR